MSRNWDEFGDGPAGTSRDEPYVSMNYRGEIVINRQIYETMQQPEAVILLFDHADDIIGVKPASPLMPNAFRVTEKGDCGHRRIRALPFARKHEIQLDGTVRFQTPTIEDGILLLELRHMVRSTRTGHHSPRLRRL